MEADDFGWPEDSALVIFGKMQLLSDDRQLGVSKLWRAVHVAFVFYLASLFEWALLIPIWRETIDR